MNDEVMKRLDNIERMLQLIVQKETATDEDVSLIDIDEAARICALSVGSLYNYLSNGKMNIPQRKKNNKIVLKREDVIRWNSERSAPMTLRTREKLNTR